MLGATPNTVEFNPNQRRFSGVFVDISEKLLTAANKVPRISMPGYLFGIESSGKLAESYPDFALMVKKVQDKIKVE